MNNNKKTATINSNNNNQIISSHCSKDKMAMEEEYKLTTSHSTKSGMMMNEKNKNKNKNKNKSAPLSNNNMFDDGVDIDLQGIPEFILNLQIKQPTLNIMTCGDVSHGKSTLLAALSGEKTGKHCEEKKRNMTIRLGYTSCKIWKCLNCPRPKCYFTTHSDTKLKSISCPNCNEKPNKSYNKYHNGSSKIILLRHLSFVDVPGHAHLMQTMVSATSVSDAAILVIDSSKKCPGNQTAQHLDAINLLGLMKEGQIIIAQNKIDLIDRNTACQSYEEIRRYLTTFGNDKLAFNTPIIPISAQSKLNIDALCNSIINDLPKFSVKLLENNKKECGDLQMNIIRSFDVNKAKDLITLNDIDKIAGGVIGGAVLNGQITVGQEIEIRPGYLKKRQTKIFKSELKTLCQPQWICQPIRTTVKSLKYGKNSTQNGYPGGNVGIQTNIDPSLTKSDGIVGHVVIDVNNPNPPPIFNQFIMSFTFLSDAIGRRSPFKEFEEVRVNIGSFKTGKDKKTQKEGAIIVPQKKLNKQHQNEDYDGVLVVLTAPICARIGDKVGLCRKNKKGEWAFVGGGIIRKTKNIFIASDQEKLKQVDDNKNKQITTSNITPQQPRKKSADTSFLKQLNEQSILELFIGNKSFVDKVINPWKSQIIAYFRENKIDGDKLLQIGRKQFAQNLVDYTKQKKIRGAANKTFDRFCKLKIDKNSIKDTKDKPQPEEIKNNDNDNDNDEINENDNDINGDTDDDDGGDIAGNDKQKLLTKKQKQTITFKNLIREANTNLSHSAFIDLQSSLKKINDFIIRNKWSQPTYKMPKYYVKHMCLIYHKIIELNPSKEKNVKEKRALKSLKKTIETDIKHFKQLQLFETSPRFWKDEESDLETNENEAVYVEDSDHDDTDDEEQDEGKDNDDDGNNDEIGVGIGANEFENGLGGKKDAVHISYQQRNGRKGLTTIVGLPSEVDFKKLKKKMQKEWSTGATLVVDKEKGTVIQIQGDVRKQVPAYIIKLNIVEKDQITVHGY